jgi:hypothetical protein
MVLTPEDKRKVQNCMILGMTEKEALDVVMCDHEIDKGIPQDFDLDPEKEKMAKKFANATTKKKPTAYNFSQRGRKANPTKAGIIAELADFLTNESANSCTEVEITNKERQIAFTVGEQKYELTLIAKRAPKK